MMRISALLMTSMLATGCFADEGGDTMRNVAAVTEEKPAAAPTPEELVANPLPTQLANEPRVRQNIVQTKCAAVPGGWSAQGTARNPGKKAVTYKVVVYFTTTKATTLDYAQALVTVPPGKTVPWTAKKQFQAKKEMLCPMPGISVVS
ncbi:hypothetical protein [Streptosporangium sp. NPDC023615]|uniref:hypothetical protein n=1 Tax=Streptosporangium sp. NPDC023615 TaxID=3154794 RepID=UPI0034450EFE